LFHRGDVCSDCAEIEQREHAAAKAEYEKALSLLQAPLKDVLAGLGDLRQQLATLRSDDARTALTQAERDELELNALWKLTLSLAPGGALDNSLVLVVKWVGRAIGATTTGGTIERAAWRPELVRVGLLLTSCALTTGEYWPVQPPDGFIFNTNEGVIAVMSASRVWQVEDKEMRYDMSGVELSATDRMTLEKGEMRGREVVTHRRTVRNHGTLVATHTRLVFLGDGAPETQPYAGVTKVESDRTSVWVSADWGQARFDVANSDLVGGLLDIAVRTSRGQTAAPPALPDMPHADEDTEHAIASAVQFGVTDDQGARRLRLNVAVDHIDRVQLEAWRKGVEGVAEEVVKSISVASEPTARNVDSAPSETALAASDLGAPDDQADGQNASEPVAATDQAASEEANPATDADIAATPRGEPLTVDSTFRVTLEDAHGYDSVTPPGREPMPADGMLIVLRLRLANLSKEAAELSSVNVALVDEDGSVYDTRTGLADRQLSWLRDCILQRRIQPKGETVGLLAFDIPKVAEPRCFRVTRGFGIGADRNGFALLSLGPPADDSAVDTPEVDASRDSRALPPPSESISEETDATSTRSDAVRSAEPPVPVGRTIYDYSDDELRQIVRWVRSDGVPRSGDQLMMEVMHVLGYRRRGKNVAARIGAAIAAESENRG
jgi:hypothetical protein